MIKNINDILKICLFLHLIHFFKDFGLFFQQLFHKNDFPQIINVRKRSL